MKKIILIAFILLLAPCAFAMDESSTQNSASQQSANTTLDNKFISIITFESLSDTMKNIDQNSEDFLVGFQKATSRYTQTNVIAAYKDFSKMITSLEGQNDFLYLTVAQRLNSLGFFTLSQNALINIEDTDLWYLPTNSLKKLYNPAVTLNYDEEIYLAQLHTATLYNASAKETIKVLEDNDKLLKKSDYANYVLAVAYFENKNYSKSLNSINKAINKAPDCLNYLHFKEKIYTQTQNYKSALKLISEIEKKGFNSNYSEDILEKDKLYILMKTSKGDKAKYYSAKLLFKTGDYQTALKEAQSAISMNKKNLDAYTIIGDYYIKTKDLEKAKDYYSKAYNIKKKHAPSLAGLGHYYYLKGDYETSLDYYKKANKYSPKDEQNLIYIANIYILTDNKDEAAYYIKKALKIEPNSDEAYYLMSKIVPAMKEQYLRTSISLNPTNIYSWLDLAEIKITQKDYKKANEYLFPVKLIDSNNQRYLYLKKIIEKQGKINEKSSYKIDFQSLESNKNIIF